LQLINKTFWHLIFPEGFLNIFQIKIEMIYLKERSFLIF
jgi:hypothetical protein